MIDATPRHLLIWGNLNEREKKEVITKFKGFKFDIMDETIKDYILKKYEDKLKVTTKVITK